MSDGQDKPKPGRPRILAASIGMISGALRCVAHQFRRTKISGGEGYHKQRILIFKCRCGEYVECTELAWIECEPQPVDCGCGLGGEPKVKQWRAKAAIRYTRKTLGSPRQEEGIRRRPQTYSLPEPMIQRIEDLAKVKGLSQSWVADQCLRIGLEELEKAHT